MEKLEQAIALLDQILEDQTVPKNIRTNSKEAIDHLRNEELDISVRVDKAIQLLDEVAEDPNIPVYTRTEVWSVVSLLESLLNE